MNQQKDFDEQLPRPSTSHRVPRRLFMIAERFQGMDMSSDGRQIVGFTTTGTMVMFSTETEQVEWEQTITPRIASVSFSQDSKLILLNLTDGGIQLRTSHQGELVRAHSGVMSSIYVLKSSFGGMDDAFVIKPEDGKDQPWPNFHLHC
jgi:hypothetical protein